MSYIIFWLGVIGLGTLMAAGFTLVPGFEKISNWLWK